MKVAGIIAEFNPLHNGHKYLIEKCKKEYGADYVVVVMSGDFVQRGAPAVVSKFTRTKMALDAGADLVLELPLYYSLGSAEYFSEGAVAILEGLSVVTDLVFGSETDDIDSLKMIADIFLNEPDVYSDAVKKAMSEGESFPSARQKGILAYLKEIGSDPKALDPSFLSILSSPNSILGVEYIKSLMKRRSKITPHAVKRLGASYSSEYIETIDTADTSFNDCAPTASAMGIRNVLFKDGDKALLKNAMPDGALKELEGYEGSCLDTNSFSDLLHYKLLLEKNRGFTRYLDVNEDISNRIISNLPKYEGFDPFCELIKTKNITYSRISRILMHILLNITGEKMEGYKAEGFTSYGRVLGMKKESSALLAKIHENATIPVIDRLKDAPKLLSPRQLMLFNNTLSGSEIYNSKARNGIVSEYSLKSLIL